jgi:dTDP-4-dehydrorhamnose reductase
MPILITGGGGRLARELLPLLPDATAPGRAELDVTDAPQVEAAVAALVARARANSLGRANSRARAGARVAAQSQGQEPGTPAIVVHAAAFTDVKRAETERESCHHVNVLGTRNVAQACARHHALLVHVSTDYVFSGVVDPRRRERGGYVEDDERGPTRNHYAYTKLLAEDEARAAPRHLVLRTSFRPREWPYPSGFTDVRTSQAYVDELAPELARAIVLAPRIVAQGIHTLHVAGEPTTVFELARRRKPNVRPASKAEAGVDLPDDVVLSTALWRRLREAVEAPTGA